VIGFVGRLDPVKGVDYLFAAAGAMGLESSDRVLIIGDGPDEARLRAAASRHGVAEHVVWAGRISEPHLVLPAMDVLVLPSVYEAFGNVLLEAMASGIPVIGRDADAVRAFTASREIIEDGSTGFITDSTNPRSLADKLQWLRSHPAERVEMGRRGRARAEGRSWSAVVDDYMAVVPELQL
jgi:glycosyltransferase involved in cell wall biosynthesis